MSADGRSALPPAAGEYDPGRDAHDSYFAAVEAKRLRGDTHWTKKPPPAWRIVSPAPRVAALDLAGARARARRLVLRQVRDVDSAAVYRGDEAMAIVYFGRHGWRRVEMALSIAPAAAPHLRRLVEMAQLTLLPMAETSLIVASIHPANAAGQRMAMLVGFRPARLQNPGWWIFRKDGHVGNPRPRQGGPQGGGGTARPAGGGE